MPTPHCPVCGRWDGSHSGGCPQTGFVYPGIPDCPNCGGRQHWRASCALDSNNKPTKETVQDAR